MVGVGAEQRSAAICCAGVAGQCFAGGAGSQRRPGGISRAAHALGRTCAAVLPADTAGRRGAAARLAPALPSGSAVRLAGLGAAVRRALLGAASLGCAVAGGGAERCPCAWLLVAAGRAGAGVALPAVGAVGVLQRLALAGLGAAAECLPLADGAAASLALAGGRLPSRIPRVGGGAAGAADARLGLAELGVESLRSQWLTQGVAGASLFALLTAMVMRTAHHWGGVPYQLDALLDSMLVQAGLSIVWTLIALPLMVLGNRLGRRELWLIGAALIALVVAKLFFVELGNRGGLERIVSFIGVGVLLLVVGYFAPLPARKADADQSQEPA